jgi:hypothetical protein
MIVIGYENIKPSSMLGIPSNKSWDGVKVAFRAHNPEIWVRLPIPQQLLIVLKFFKLLNSFTTVKKVKL